MNKRLQSLLKKIAKTQDKYWNIGPDLGQFLHILIKDRNYKSVLEIGTSTGYSGLWMADALSQTKGKLYTIESHAKERFPLGAANFKKSGLNKYIIHILGHAPEDLPKSPRYFDMAFLDATKNEHISYFKAVAPRIKKGGLIITDNVGSHRQELATYLTHVRKQKNWQSFELNIGSGVLISLRKPTL